MGPIEEPERPGDAEEMIELEREAPPAPPAAPGPVAARVAARSALSWLAHGVVIVGSVGFMAGFIGPIILRPSANQGPLLGIFFTGPIGVVLGFVLGIVCATLFRDRPRAAATTLAVGSVLYAAVVVIVIL